MNHFPPDEISGGNLVSFLARIFEGFDRQFDGSAHEEIRSFGGEVFRCRSSSAEYLESVKQHVVSHPENGLIQSCRILITTNEECGFPDWIDQGIDYHVIRMALSGTPYRVNYFSEYQFWQFWDGRGRRGIQLMSSPAIFPPWEPGSPLRNFFHWHFISIGKQMLHAGSLAHDGKGVLLAGGGGSGKSGTVIGGILNGLESVGDDYVMAALDGKKLKAFPVFNSLRQDSAGFQRLDLSRYISPDRPLNWQGKYQFTIADIPSKPFPMEIDIRALVIPIIHHARNTSFEMVSGKKAFLTLTPSTVFQNPGDREITFSTCAKFCRVVPSFHMYLGTDPSEISTSIREFISCLHS